MRSPPSLQLKRIAAIGILLFLISVVGYMAVEQLSLLDAIYMTVLALSTVGFGEVHPLSPPGRAFTIGVIIVGVGTGAYLLGTFAEYVIAGELAGTLRQRRVMHTIQKMHDHFIVCGYGRVGTQVTSELRNLNLPCVVIEKDAAVIEHAQLRDLPFVKGDASEDEVLQQAGIERARGLLAVLSEDSDNVFVVLSARSLNRDLLIIARATNETTERKLLKAGADHVVSPYVMAGHRIMSLLVHPHVVNFLDTTMRHHELEWWLEEISIAHDSPLVGQSLQAASIRTSTGANVLAILRGADSRIVDWSPELTLQANDILIVMGKQEQLKALAQLAGDMHASRPFRLRELVTKVETAKS